MRQRSTGLKQIWGFRPLPLHAGHVPVVRHAGHVAVPKQCPHLWKGMSLPVPEHCWHWPVPLHCSHVGITQPSFGGCGLKFLEVNLSHRLRQTMRVNPSCGLVAFELADGLLNSGEFSQLEAHAVGSARMGRVDDHLRDELDFLGIVRHHVSLHPHDSCRTSAFRLRSFPPRLSPARQ